MPSAIAPPQTQVTPPLSPEKLAQKSNMSQQIMMGLKKVIESVYTDGITAILKANLSANGSIEGKFADGPQVYTYSINSQGKLTYNEAEAEGVRSDAYLLGYTVDSGMALQGRRFDFVKPPKKIGDRTPKCEEGKRCGGGCIKRGYQCSVDLSPQMKDLSGQIRSAISHVKAVQPKQTLENSKATPDAKAEVPAAKNTFENASEESSKSSKASKKGGNLWKKAALTMAALAGVSAAAYLATRERYRSGFKESAEMAKEKAKTIQVGSVKARQHTIVFGVGGMAYGEESPEVISGERIITSAKMAFSRDKGKDLKLVPINNAADNVPEGRKRGGKADQLKDVADIYYRNLQRGRNPVAVDLAANVLAYAEAHPDKQLVMMGHSRGGAVVHEAQEILRLANPELEGRLKSLLFGTQYGGITEKFGESYTIGSPHDTFTSKLPTRDLQSFDSVQGHSQSAYFSNPDVKNFVSDLLYRDVKIPAESEAKKQPQQQSKKQKKSNPPPEVTKTDSYYLGLLESVRRQKATPASVA